MFLGDRDKRASVANRAGDLEPIAHDARILHERAELRGVEARDFAWIEARERAPIRVALVEDRAPTETCLRAFEDEELEERAVVMDGPAPFLVVVLDHFRVA